MTTVRFPTTYYENGEAYGFDMGDNFFPVPAAAYDVTETSTAFVLYYAPNEYDRVIGSGFRYDPVTGEPYAGTISAWDYVIGGHSYFSASAINMSVATFMSYFNSNNWDGFLQEALKGNDTITGSGGGDILYGKDGNDVISGGNSDDLLDGGAGNDTLDGGAGDDRLIGGTGDDTYIINSLTDEVIENVNEGTDTVKSAVALAAAIANIENYTYTGKINWTFTGTTADNIIIAGAGSDTLDGGQGNDTLDGGVGLDTVTYANRAAGVTVDLTTGSAQDGTYTDTLKNIENVIGSAFVDTLTGSIAANVLDGRAGDDVMSGGKGNDTYLVDSSADQVIEDTAGTAGGIDLVKATASFTLGANVENLTLLGSGDIDGTGNALNNVIIGNGGDNVLQGKEGNDTLNAGEGNDTLDGGTGSDILTGGKGDDLYIVDAATDKIVELANEGTDTVRIASSYSSKAFAYTLAATLENLDLSQVAVAVTATGNALANEITGGSGNDTLNGGAGADKLSGGQGDDIYILDNLADQVLEDDGEGIDTVKTAVALATAFDHVENYTFTGKGNWSFIGTTADNIIIAGAGGDTLDGGQGNDTLDGGAGLDTVTYANRTAGVTVDLTTGTAQDGTYTDTLKNIENVIGSAFVDTLTGSIAANVLDGGAGDDVMSGGKGNDTYLVDSSADQVIEDTAGTAGGIDLVKATASFTLGANVENLTLLGSGGIDGTGNALNNVIIGNGGDNVLQGKEGNDTLNAGEGNDTLDGGTGSDILTGGKGDDLYIVDAATDKIVELANEGTDTVRIASSYSSKAFAYTLAATLENLDLSQVAVAVTATGNALANEITGGSGNDTLNGGAGADKLSGGQGDDIYILDNLADQVLEDDGEGIDTVKTAVALATAFDHVENYTFTGKGNWSFTGNGLANVITAGAGGDTLDGGQGNDTLDGGVGLDTVTYANRAAGVTVDLTTGSAQDGTYTDTLKNIENVIGSAFVDTLTGSIAANVLDGRAGDDVMSGGKGNDTYLVDSSADQVIEDTAGTAGGIDLVKATASFTLGANVENLTLLGSGDIDGTGNALNNVIIGNGGDNVLQGKEGNDTLNAGEGNDTLDGGTGSDILTGGKGDDLYIVDAATDKIVELANEGTDTVRIASSYSSKAFAYTLAATLENLDLSQVAVAVTATGNALANEITGGSGNDTLNGGAGADKLSGGQGDDIYILDNLADQVLEDDGEGIDTVKTAVALATAFDHVENYTFTGKGNWSFIGNGLDNIITGTAGKDILDGGDGNDTLIGNGGVDTLYGGTGDDTYVTNDITAVHENANEGIDTLQTGAFLAASHYVDGVENYIYTGAVSWTFTLDTDGRVLGGGSGHDTLTGNTLDNTITGGAGNDKLAGLDGNDTLNGGIGADKLDGGAGDDSYFVDNAGDQIIDSSGHDHVSSTVHLDLTKLGVGAIEDATLLGTAALNATGNDLDNHLAGNDGKNTLSGGKGADNLEGQAGDDTLLGGDGDDVLAGGLGNDRLTGGAGSDTFVLDLSHNDGKDIVTDFDHASDKLSFKDIVDIGGADILDYLNDHAHLTDAGIGRDVTLTFDNNSTVIVFASIGTGGITSFAQLVNDPAAQIHAA